MLTPVTGTCSTSPVRLVLQNPLSLFFTEEHKSLLQFALWYLFCTKLFLRVWGLLCSKSCFYIFMWFIFISFVKMKYIYVLNNVLDSLVTLPCNIWTYCNKVSIRSNSDCAVHSAFTRSSFRSWSCEEGDSLLLLFLFLLLRSQWELDGLIATQYCFSIEIRKQSSFHPRPAFSVNINRLPALPPTVCTHFIRSLLFSADVQTFCSEVESLFVTLESFKERETTRPLPSLPLLQFRPQNNRCLSLCSVCSAAQPAPPTRGFSA